MRVLSGATVVLQDESDLTDAERSDGWILGCCRAASSDVELDVEDLTGLDLPKPRTLPCRIDAIDDVAPGVRRFVLRLPPSAQFAFLPGQHVDIIGPGGHRRSYSLAETNLKEGHLVLHVRQVPGGALSAYWFGAARKDDLLRLHGPKGTFVLRDVAGAELVFLATGTGIAPITATLAQVASLPPDVAPNSVQVIWGGRVSEDLYLDPGSICPETQYTPTLSQAQSEWEGPREYVQDVLISSSTDLSNTRVYACGSDRMISAARAKLLAAGLPARAFYSDAFVSSAPNEPI